VLFGTKIPDEIVSFVARRVMVVGTGPLILNVYEFENMSALNIICIAM
jgi:hypothetical protein